jgi:hypothetical protein
MYLTLLVTFRYESERFTQERVVWFRKIDGASVRYKLIRMEVDEEDDLEDTLRTMFPASEFPEAKWAAAEMDDTQDDERVAAVNVGTVHDEQTLIDALKKDEYNYFAGPHDGFQAVPLEKFWTLVDRAGTGSRFDERDTLPLYAMHEGGMLKRVGVSTRQAFWQSTQASGGGGRVDRNTIVFHENSPARAGAKRKDADSKEAGGRIRRGCSSLVELRAKETALLEQLQSVRNEIAKAEGTADVSDDSDGDP